MEKIKKEAVGFFFKIYFSELESLEKFNENYEISQLLLHLKKKILEGSGSGEENVYIFDHSILSEGVIKFFRVTAVVEEVEVEEVEDDKKFIIGNFTEVTDLYERIETLKKKVLSGIIPICANCKKIRKEDGGNGKWEQIEGYIQKRTEAEFSHSICPECAKELYPELDLFDGIED